MLRTEARQGQGRGEARRRVGLVVNPIAGLGGSVAFKGTEDAAMAGLALRLGARPAAPERARRALAVLAPLAERAELLAAAGALGGDVLNAAGLPFTALPVATAEPSTAADTRQAVRAMVAAGVELVVFAGGDGTAADVLAASGGQVPLLGIPAGVKMHSGVFATSPEAAGQLLARLVRGEARLDWREAEVLDVEPEALRAGRISPRLIGTARVPHEPRLVQAPKARRGAGEEMVLAAIAGEVVAGAAPGVVQLLGPGTTLAAVKRAFGFAGSLLGVDAVLDGEVRGLDLTERQILELIDGRPARIVVGVTGGQGFVLGRGNQQLSPVVLRQVGRAGLLVVASPGKLVGLAGGALRLDTGDAGLDRQLAGYLRVLSGPGEWTVMALA